MRLYNCRPRPTPPVVIDYSVQLDSIIDLARRILIEVGNHQVVAQVDLTPVVDELSRIYSEMQNVTTNIQASTQLLLTQFLAVANSIEDFKSATLLAFASLQQSVVTEGNETQLAIEALALQIKNSNAIVEIDLHPYEFIILAGASGGVFRIPEGTIELVVFSKYCEEITINGLKRFAGTQVGETLRAIGNRVATDGIYEIEIQPEDEISVSWRSLRNLGDIQILSGDLIAEKSTRYPRSLPPVAEDLQSLIDLATEGAI